jgi:hypothetical protein
MLFAAITLDAAYALFVERLWWLLRAELSDAQNLCLTVWELNSEVLEAARRENPSQRFPQSNTSEPPSTWWFGRDFESQ